MKHSFEIKICGINDQISMNAALNIGVNYIGLVFYHKSPRNLSITRAKLLTKNRTKKSLKLQNVKKIGRNFEI